MAIDTYEERRKREKQAELTRNYREIGSGAILAALVCAHREREAKEAEAIAAKASKAA